MKIKDVTGMNNIPLRAGTPFLYFKANQDARKYGETTAPITAIHHNYKVNKDLLELMPLSKRRTER